MRRSDCPVESMTNAPSMTAPCVRSLQKGDPRQNSTKKKKKEISEGGVSEVGNTAGSILELPSRLKREAFAMPRFTSLIHDL